jgi:hypothetical protein
MTNWTSHVINVNGAFLKARFNTGEATYLKFHGVQKLYKRGMVLKLGRTTQTSCLCVLEGIIDSVQS